MRFLSISVDQQTDTPAVLKAFADRHGIAGDWTFVTGRPSVLSAIPKAFAAEAARQADYTPLIFIRDAKRCVWVRKYGLAPPEAITDAIRMALRP